MKQIELDVDGAVDRMGSRELFVEIARSFAEALPGTEEAIASAIESKVWHDARRLVHSLKSNCAAMGAEALREQAYTLEKACADGDEATVRELFPSLRPELQALRATLLSL